MKNDSTNSPIECSHIERRTVPGRSGLRAKGAALALAVAALAVFSGCETAKPPTAEDMAPAPSVKIEEGDSLGISFPGSPNLNTTQRVRQDGKIQLQVVGEVTALGKTPAELEEELLKLYDKELVLKQVTVTLQSTAYPVYVSGLVVRPGKVLCDRPMTALEVIMEAGGFDHTRANMKHVTVVRKQDGQLKHFKLNLKAVLEGQSMQQFYVRARDIVHVPEKSF
jgi:polysaccharide export outer membrane protein